MLLPENHFREAQSRLSREFWFRGPAAAAPGGLTFALAAESSDYAHPREPPGSRQPR